MPHTLEQAASAMLSYNLLLRLFSESADAIIITDGEAIIAVNREAETMFGYHGSQMVGERIEMLLPLDRREIHARHRADYLAAPRHRPMGSGQVLEGQHKDGHNFAVEINLNCFQEVEGLRVVATVRRAK
jgi:PAS domain S-box-containing protein